MSKKVTVTPKPLGFWHKPTGYFISAVVLIVAGYILASLAIDSGSIVQWFGAIVAVLWGAGRFTQGVKQAVFHKSYGKKRR